MRPLELTLEGFRSYADRVTFDWRSRRLVGIVGPIGSGKSTVLDGIAFALYGKTPAIGSGTHQLIHQQRDVAQVRLTFRVEGGAWQVTRAIRRKGAAQHLLAPFDEASGHVDQGRAISGQAAVTRRVEQLLGLDFDAFRRSILLAQGRFQEFLQASPTEKDKVLRGVFGLDRIAEMHRIATDREREARAEADQAARRIAEAAEARERIARAETELASERAHLAALEALRPRVEAARTEATTARQQRESADVELARLTELAQTLPRAEQSEATLLEFEVGNTAATAAALAAAAATERARAARAALARVITETGTRDALAQARAALEALTQARAAEAREQRAVAAASGELERARAEVAEMEKQHAAAAAAERRARGGAESAEAESRAAREALDGAQHRQMALAVRAGLATGEACPVCGQHVATFPPVEAAPDLDAARAAEEAARAATAHAQAALQRAASVAAAAAARVTASERTVTAAAEALARAEQEAAGASALVAAATERVAGLLGAPATATEVLAGRRARLTAVEQTADAAERAEQAARSAADAATAGAQRARQAFVALRVALAKAAGALGIPADDVDDAPAARVLLASLRAGYLAARDAAQARRGTAETAMQVAQAHLDTVLREAGIEPSAGYEAAITDVQLRIARIDGALESDRRAVAGAGALKAAADSADERLARYATLKDDLTPSQFLGYLLADERATLANIGSERFEQLSGGRYRFKDENFAIVDLSAAESERNADTLSGGETFLASLALALALAEMVTREGGRLDAFFLDEGFGSLDEEHLDLAMEGIERLVAESEERLVVVVSHVVAMKERIEDLVILDRNPATGHTLVRRGAGPRE